ncbi:glycerol kinase [Trema orientale]|uniref:Glycerol kinase n=1 Tax=Trema orientale TaxID=63057 RepID=A0A2P5EWH8_TREOI|nr:glycerol kinase [Trema orientale]
MALAFNGVIPQTRALGTSRRLSSPCHKASHTQFPTWVSLPKKRISSSSAKIDSTLSDVEFNQLQDHANGFSPTPTSTGAWAEFAKNVSGEWDGFGADFSNEGDPIELPERVVPEAFREWEVKVFDWQTQCPTLAHPEELLLSYKLIKLLPTVGCEADAATRFSIDERNVGGPNSGVSAFTYQPSGSYVAVWPIDEKGPHKLLELEHCLINPEDRESRVRIIQIVRVENEKMVLHSVRVFVEQWYGPFRNGDQLGGCSIRDSAFASTSALKASELIGVWQGPATVAKFDGSQDFLQLLLDDSDRKLERDERDIVLLPKQLWCSVKACKDGDTLCEVGWLFNHGHAITSECTFSSKATLKASLFVQAIVDYWFS